MSKRLYTARASVTGGPSGHGSTSDGALDVQLRPLVELVIEIAASNKCLVEILAASG